MALSVYKDLRLKGKVVLSPWFSRPSVFTCLTQRVKSERASMSGLKTRYSAHSPVFGLLCRSASRSRAGEQ